MMKQNIFLIISFCALLLIGVPQKVFSISFTDGIETSKQDVIITMNESTMHVSGANGKVLQVFNITGVCVMSIKVDSAEKNYELNLTKGCYIVKVGKTVRKIFIK